MQTKWLTTLTLSLALLVTPSCQPVEQPVDTSALMEADIRAITALHEAWVNTVRTLDADGEMKLWTEDGVVMEPNALPYVGKVRMRGRLNFFDEVTIENPNVNVEELEVGGDWAFIRQSFKAIWKPKDGSAPYEEDGKEIMIFKKQADQSWKIARYIWNTNLPATTAME